MILTVPINDVHDPLDCSDQFLGLLEPAIRIVDDSVTVDEQYCHIYGTRPRSPDISRRVKGFLVVSSE